MAAARAEVLIRAGWDVESAGLDGGPRSGSRRGRSVTARSTSPAGTSGWARRSRCRAMSRGASGSMRSAATLAAGDGPAIVVLQAGNIHSGAFDDFGAAIAVAHEAGAWVHVDGAFGLWAAAPRDCGTSLRAWMPPTPGRPTPTRRSACRTTAASPSCATGVRCTTPSACMRATCRRPRSAPTRMRRCPNSRGGRAACPRGRCCARSAAPASRHSWSGWRIPHAASPTASPSCRASRCSTTSSSPRCASPSRTMRRPRRSASGCGTRATCSR